MPSRRVYPGGPGRCTGPRSTGRRRAVAGETGVRLPQLHFDDGEALLGRDLEEQPGDVLGRRVDVHHVERLALLAEQGEYRVVLVQQHLVVEVLVDPAADGALEAAEIEDHAQRVERRRRQG